jgi:hypothetical protein
LQAQAALADELPRRFQLNCRGESTTLTGSGVERKSSNTIIQVNRDSEIWCRNNCKYIQKIYSEFEDRIVLRNGSEKDPKKELMDVHWYIVFDKDRRSLYELYISDSFANAFEGNCEIEQFQP